MTTTIQSAATTLREPGVEFEFDEAQLAAVSFLVRYSGRTLEAYRHDLRGFFQWATDNRVVVLGANRAHIELFRAWMEDRGLAASLSTVASRRSVGSTGSRTSTDVSARTFDPRPEPKIDDDAQTEAQDLLGEAPEFLFDLLPGRFVPGSAAQGPEPFILREAHGAAVRGELGCECGLTRSGQPAGQNQSRLAHGGSVQRFSKLT
jgi:Phage integrase, N-terminal SAM-like domain